MHLLRPNDTIKNTKRVEARSKPIKIFVCLVFLAGGFLIANNAHAATYYVRADGTVTAASKANATSPTSSTTALNMEQVQSATFAAGDQILFSSQGGNYTATLAIPSGGSGVGTEITYANVPTETPVITGAFSPMINTNSTSNVKVIGFSVTYSGTGSSANGIVISGNSSSNIAINYNTVNMGGYGYGILSGANNLSGVSLDHNSVSNVGATKYTMFFYGTGASNFSLTNYTVVENSTGGTYLGNINGLTINSFNASGSGGTILDIESCSGVVNINNVTENITGGSGILLNSCVFGIGSTMSSTTVQNSTGSAAFEINNSTGNIAVSSMNVVGKSVTGYSIFFLNSALTNSSLSATVSSTAQNGFQFNSSSGFTVSSASYSGTGSTGYGFSNASNITVSNSSFSGTGVGTGGGGGYYVYNNSHNISFNSDTSDGLTSWGGFLEQDSTNISYTDCTAVNGMGFTATIGTGSSSNITYLRCHAGSQSKPNPGASSIGFLVNGAVNGVTYTYCVADYNGGLGFAVENLANNVSYWYDEASYNGTVNNTSNGGGFLPHTTATNIKAYYSITHHNFNEGIGDVSNGTNMFYNSVNLANGYAIGDTFNGSTVTVAPTLRGNMYLNKTGGNGISKNIISGGGKPRERSDYGPQYTTFDYDLYSPLDNNAFTTNNGGTTQITWATYHLTNEPNSQNADPLFANGTGSYSTSTDFQLLYLSPAIDAGTTTSNMTSTTTDYAGNPIYGTPDIGAYEYQPPFTIGTNLVDPTGNIRIYGDGKYRYTTATSSTMSANLSATPLGGFATYDASTTRPEWLNISNITWGTTKQWTASSSSTTIAPYGVQATTTIYAVGNLTPNTIYLVTVDNATSTAMASTSCSNGYCTSGSDGKLILTYTGGYTTHTFTITPDATPPSVSLTYPTAGTVSGNVTLTATASDNVAVAGVQFKLDLNTPIGSEITSTSSPNTYTTTWNSASVSDGSHTLSSVARDASGNYATSTVVVTVSNAVSTPAPVTYSGGSSSSSGGSAYVAPVPVATTTPTVPGCPVGVTCTPSATPNCQTTASTATSFTRSLTLGSTGSDIKALQVLLNSHGFTVSTYGNGSSGHETTYYGPATASAVSRFQNAYAALILTPSGLTHSTGYFGPATMKEANLLSVSTTSHACLTPTALTTPPVSTAYSFTSDLTLGSQGSGVKALQVYLNNHGYTVAPSGSGSPSHESSYFGPATKAALMKFQKDHGITATGFFGPKTRTAIEAAI